jgi:hypothetical protein
LASCEPCSSIAAKPADVGAVIVSARAAVPRPGLAVPMPTLPAAEMSRLLVGAPGRMRSGKVLPPVTSRTKKFASLPAISQVCAVNPPPACSRRIAGVSPLSWCSFRTGVVVPSPTLPTLSTWMLPVAAPAVTVNGVFAPVMSTIEKRLGPPEAVVIGLEHPVVGGEGASRFVSWNSMRVLFSFSRMVENPNDSPSTQSRPTQRLPWMMLSSGVTTSLPARVARRLAGAARLDQVLRDDPPSHHAEGTGEGLAERARQCPKARLLVLCAIDAGKGARLGRIGLPAVGELEGRTGRRARPEAPPGRISPARCRNSPRAPGRRGRRPAGGPTGRRTFESQTSASGM